MGARPTWLVCCSRLKGLFHIAPAIFSGATPRSLSAPSENAVVISPNILYDPGNQRQNVLVSRQRGECDYLMNQ
jgi:hypothetical protein